MRDLATRRRIIKTILGLVLLVQVTACTAHYPINHSIVSTAAVEGFSIGDKPDSRLITVRMNSRPILSR